MGDVLRETFDIFDTDNDGIISLNEIIHVLESLGYNYSEVEIEEMVREVDLDGDGAINFREFEQLMDCSLQEGEQGNEEEHLLEAFGLVDEDHDGYISEMELRELRDNLNMDFNDHELHEMITSVDDDGDGFINYRQFTRMISHR